MAEFSIRATPNGPYIVQGATELLDTAGDKYPLDKESISLSVGAASRVTNHSVTGPTVRLVSRLLKKSLTGSENE